MKTIETGTIAIEKLKVDFDKNIRKSVGMDSLKDMAESVRAQGIINPVEIDTKNNVVTGSRRVLAAKTAGIKDIEFKRLELTDMECLERQLVENLNREDVTAIECLPAIKKLLRAERVLPNEGRGPKNIQGEIAKRLGMSPSWMTRILSLDSAPEPIKRAVDEGKLAPSTAIEITETKLPDKTKIEIAERAVKNKFGHRQARQDVKYEKIKQDIKGSLGIDVEAIIGRKTIHDFVKEFMDTTNRLYRWLDPVVLTSGKLNTSQEEGMRSCLKDLKERVDWWLKD